MTLAAVALAALVAQSPGPSALAGVALGAPAKDAVAAHNGKSVASPWGPTWQWNAPSGVVRVTADQDGDVAIVELVLAKTAKTVDLPAAAGFAIAPGWGHEKYSEASTFVESDTCTPDVATDACYAYTLDDGELVLQFGTAGLGPVRDAILGNRALLKSLGVIQAQTSL